MGLKNVFDRMFLRHLIDVIHNQIMCIVYQTFHDECLKNIFSITFISLAIL